MSRLHVIVACYGGDRRTRLTEYEQDRGFLIKLQVEALGRLKYDADITFVDNGGPEDYQRALGSVPFRVVEHDNTGFSYGAWNKAWSPVYDYTFFLEDDYVFVKDRFDAALISAFESFESCDYLCQYVVQNPDFTFPSAVCGMASRHCMETLGHVPGHLGQTYGDVQHEGQLMWGWKMQELGLALRDMTPWFKVPFDDSGRVIHYADEAPEYLMVPARMYPQFR